MTAVIGGVCGLHIGFRDTGVSQTFTLPTGCSYSFTKLSWSSHSAVNPVLCSISNICCNYCTVAPKLQISSGSLAPDCDILRLYTDSYSSLVTRSSRGDNYGEDKPQEFKYYIHWKFVHCLASELRCACTGDLSCSCSSSSDPNL